MLIARLPTPPVAPVTTTGPFDGRWPFCSMRWTASAAVKPAVPSFMASSSLIPAGSGITDVAGQAGEFRVAAVLRLGEAAAGDQHLLARRESRVGRGHDLAGEVDAADQRIATQDAALAGRGERVLVVDVGVTDPHHDVARAQVVERDLVETRDDAAVDFVDAECAHGGHED